MVLSSKIQRAFLDNAWDATDASGLSLRDQLRACEDEIIGVMGGGSLASTSANGRSIAFAQAFGRNASHTDILETWRRLIDVHDQCVSDTGLVPGNDDAKIHTAMLTAYLREVMGTTNNFMYLAK